MDTTRSPSTTSPATAHVLPNLVVSTVVTVVVAVVNGGGWPFWLMGALYALVLALGTWCGSAPALREWTLRPAAHAVAAAVALVVGGLAFWLTGGEDNAYWGVGVIAGIATSISAAAWRRAG